MTSQRTLMASTTGSDLDNDEWAQHNTPQEHKTALIHQLLRFRFNHSFCSFLLRESASSHASLGKRMDGISQESPLVGLISVWDSVEGFIYDYPSLPLALCIACVYLSIFRSLKSIALLLGLLTWSKRLALLSALHQLFPLSTIYRSIIAGLVVCICVKLVLPRRGSDINPNFDGPSLPHLIPARTIHTRVVPKKHSFAYSYLMVGIPVGWDGDANGMISVDASKRSSILGTCSAWYNVESVEYLERGAAHLGLRGKLANFLRSQDVDPSSYPYAYFVTAPKFLGYSFNPVSLWYLYSKHKTLSAIVLEVNNTFGERRPYLVTRDFEAEAKLLEQPNPNPAGDVPRARIKNTWPKDFHVSPFNSRNGSYSLVAADPLGEGMKGFGGLDVTINLSSSKGQSKIVARLFSDGKGVDPWSLGTFQQLRFLASWFWTGFLTVPRIIAEAGKLFFKRKLHVWYRPEPLKESLGRLADQQEIVLEAVFRAYLGFLVEKSPSPLKVTYAPCGIFDRTEEMFLSPSAKIRPIEWEEVRIKILTPSFYSRFIGYAHDVEAVFCEMAESCTLWIDKPDALPKIFIKRPSPPLHAASILDFTSFKLIKALRRRPETIKRPMTSAETTSEAPHAADIRDFRMSSMDAFVLGQESTLLKQDYRRAALKHFVAERFLFGSTAVLEAVIFFGEVSLAYVVASTLDQAAPV